MRYIKHIVSILFLILTFYCSAQQSPMYSQYMFNDFIINPSVAGTYDYYQVRATNRFQWIGIKDAPITNVLSVYGPHKKLPSGWGASVYSDNQGPTGKIGFYGSYAYNIKIYDDFRLSFGLSAGIIQFKIDETKIDFAQQETGLSKQNLKYLIPDANTGLYLYSEKFYFGFSVDQLFQNKLAIEYSKATHRIDSINRLKSHFTSVVGYKFKINKELDLEPTALFRATGQSKPQIEGDAKLTYNKKVWVGAGFRTSDAVSLLLGYNFEDKIYIGYSYDITTSRLKVASQGTHEIMIGSRFNKIKTTRNKRR